ncbi:MAG: STAS domain-containing protein [Chloroflexi bacterium]|nr:STAS domain-containing protein [Chloroflexota bacterium]
MNVESRRDGTNLVLKADGRVDGTNASEFQDAMKGEIEESDRAVILDLEDLTYISSAGLRVVLLIAKDLQRQGAKMAACSLSEPVKEVFVISGFDKIIPIHETQDAAMGAIG